MDKHTARPSTVVVLGGSIAGLLAAAAAAPHTDHLVVVERDALPQAPGARPGTPQALHTHGLLASGRQAMEQLLPGLTEDLLAQGGFSGDIGTSGPWWLGGHRLVSTPVDAMGLLVSRPVLEAYLRKRVRALPDVTVLDRTDARGLASSRPGAVTGVVTQHLDHPAPTAPVLEADVVVDATGRPGRAARWFADHGWTVPAEERVLVGVRYRTVHVRHQDGDLDGALVVISAATPRVPRAGAALRQEDGTWIVTLAGYLEEQPPDDADGLRRFASTVVAPEIGALLDRDLVDAPVGYRFPHAVRRRVEDVTLPQGYAVLGDAISSFNPIFGQGISVAALQAVALGEALGSAAADGGTERVLRRYHQEATRYVDHAWAIATGADLQIPGVVGHRPRGHAAVAAYVRRVQRVAERDPAVAREMIRVAALLDPPPALMRPKVASHVLRAGTPGRGRRLRRRASTAATGARVDHGPGG